jgi:hypothetical protein
VRRFALTRDDGGGVRDGKKLQGAPIDRHNDHTALDASWVGEGGHGSNYKCGDIKAWHNIVLLKAGTKSDYAEMSA